MVFEKDLVTEGRYPEAPLEAQDMSKPPFLVGDAIIHISGMGRVFLAIEAPYKFVYARRPPPDPYYVDWYVKLDNGSEISTYQYRLASTEELKAAISKSKREAEMLEEKIKTLEKNYERTLN